MVLRKAPRYIVSFHSIKLVKKKKLYYTFPEAIYTYIRNIELTKPSCKINRFERVFSFVTAEIRSIDERGSIVEFTASL